jgi:HTH-type transcriptional regulator/antitoxin HipB
VDYPVQLSSQLQQLLKSLRKSRRMTQAELARRLGVVQSRVADIERDPGAVSVEQLLQVLAMLGAQMLVRETATEASATKARIDLEAHAQAKATATATLTTESKPAVPTPDAPPDCPPDDEPRGHW